MPVFESQPTPNPNSLKIVRKDGGGFISQGMESFTSAAQAQGHPIGQPLFEVSGVAGVFLLPQFLTVTKAPDADWDEVLPAVESALNAYFETQG